MATMTLTYIYADSTAVLGPLATFSEPHSYDLCEIHGKRLTVPNGWTVINVHLSFVPLVNAFQLLKVTRWAKKLEKDLSTKVALVGDFNLPWGIPTRITKWKRATQALSYPSWKPAISFDYILLRVSEIKSAREVIAPLVPISDHRPISIEFE